ncbi:MAG: MBL fold metallo-hydrolase [Hyphomicrobiales bacterium]
MFKLLLSGLAIAAFLITSAPDARAQDKSDFEVILVGTGTPPPLMHRFGPATLVRVAGKNFLVDAGRGATQMLWRKKIPFGKLDSLILTHLHSDHVVGIPDLWLTGWLRGPYGRRDVPFPVMGPKGTANLMNYLQKAYAWDVDTRVVDQKMSREAAGVSVKEIGPGVVYDADGLKITAFETDHGKLIKPTLGYRFDYDGRSVVVSGDTKYSENLINHSKGVDVLVHSIGAAKKELLEAAPIWKLILDHHIEPEDAGKVFTATAPRLAVYTHVVSLTNGKIKPVGAKEILDRTRTTYKGPLVMGKDLMSIIVTKDTVKAVPFVAKKK